MEHNPHTPRLEFIPITVMVAIIAALNVNLNQGSLSGYIFLCQMITIPFPSVGYPSWLVSATTLYDRDQYLFSLLPLSIWNIGIFFSYYYDPQYNPLSICISQFTTPIEYLLFWYISNILLSSSVSTTDILCHSHV